MGKASLTIGKGLARKLNGEIKSHAEIFLDKGTGDLALHFVRSPNPYSFSVQKNNDKSKISGLCIACSSFLKNSGVNKGPYIYDGLKYDSGEDLHVFKKFQG